MTHNKKKYPFENAKGSFAQKILFKDIIAGVHNHRKKGILWDAYGILKQWLRKQEAPFFTTSRKIHNAKHPLHNKASIYDVHLVIDYQNDKEAIEFVLKEIEKC